jgi:hypothetical protein
MTYMEIAHRAAEKVGPVRKVIEPELRKKKK